MYGKLINGKIEFAPRTKVVVFGERRIFNPQQQDFFNAGYKPIEYGKQPETTKYQYLSVKFTESEYKIIGTYFVVDMTPEQREEVDAMEEAL